jgi:acetylornithine/N-succinyldiaminopimelate aminotransferase
VRFLPPLIVSEAEIAEAVAMIDRACTRIARAQPAARERGAVG